MTTATLKARVHAIRYEAEDIVSVELRPASATIQFPSFEPGSHIDLHLGNGLVRSYSLCNLDMGEQRYVVGVLNDRASRGGSRYVHETLRVGSTLRISAPRNNFRLQENASATVLVAGGIGITPIFAMLQKLHQLGRRARVVYCARSREAAAFREAIAALARDDVQWHFDAEAGGPPDLKAMLAGLSAETHFYCCGPTRMLDAYQQSCAELGYRNVHLERFTAPLRDALPDEAAQHGFDVELRRSGRVVQVPPDRSILDVLQEVGVHIDSSCREGVCGSCETAVLEGDVDHRDCVLSETERTANKSMMICVSRCRSGRLVLDK